nr:hypothetical protein [Nostoc sp. ChiSLP03a]
MQPPLRPERAHDYSSAKYPQLDNPQLGLLGGNYGVRNDDRRQMDNQWE